MNQPQDRRQVGVIVQLIDHTRGIADLNRKLESLLAVHAAR